MKLKSFKKIINQHLFNFNISKNLFLIFEIQKNSICNLDSITIQSFSKQIFKRICSIIIQGNYLF